MAPNKFLPHVFVLPEDDQNREMAVGFEKDYRIKSRVIQVVPIAGGHLKAIEKLKTEYFPILESNSNSRIIVLIDCDNDANRIPKILADVPGHLQDRVFVLGALDEPESLKTALKLSAEKIGEKVADSCFDEKLNFWTHEQLEHNLAEVRRLRDRIAKEVFESWS